MKTVRGIFLLLLMVAASAMAQTDAPPELHQPTAPEETKPLPSPTPRVRGTLQVTFVGNTSFNERELRAGIARQIETIEESGLDAPNAYDASFFLDSFYRKQGFPEVESDAEITGPWQLRLKVDEGPYVRVGTVVIEGNKSYDTETLAKYLLGPTRERFPRIRKEINLPFVQADISAGVGLIARLYAAEGFLNAVITGPEIKIDPETKTAQITVRIEEGTQFVFGDITWVGPLIFPKETLLAEVAAQTQRIYTDGRVAAAQRILEDYYKSHGYFTAQVDVTGDPEAAKGGRVPVLIKVAAGKLFRFDGNLVSGNSGVSTSFIQKRMSGLQGTVYNPKSIDEKFRMLIGTGLFQNVRIHPETVNGDEVKLNVEVEEAKPKEFGLGLGYATFDGLILNGSYTNRNLFGSGRPLTIDVEWNQRGYFGEMVYTDPWLFDTDYKLKARLYAMTRELKGYSKNELGFVPTVSRELTKHFEVAGFFRAKTVRLNDVLIDPESLVGPLNYNVLSFGVSATLDYRNNIAIPTSGYILSAALDFAPDGVSDVSFVRGVVRFSYYIPVTAKSSLAIGARGGIISPLNGQDLPIDERFFNGGATSVRSYSELTLGPRDHAGYPLGGEAFTVFNIEYDFPLFGDLYGAVFVDAGNVIADAAHFGVEDMRYAVGAGLRYNLPIGSIRFDYGYNPDRQPGDAQGAFHFAIGVAF